MQENPRSNGQFMYSPNNNTNENIEAYLQNRNKSFYLNNSYQNPENSLSLLPYNSMPISQYQVGYQFNPQFDNRQKNNTTNNISTNEINLESSIEPNLNNETEQNNTKNTNNDEIKKEEPKNEIVEDPDGDVFEQNKVEEKKNEGDEEVLSALSEESNNEKEYKNHLLAQYEKVKRVKNKWKVTLKGCIAQKDDMEYVCGKVHGELSRDW